MSVSKVKDSNGNWVNMDGQPQNVADYIVEQGTSGIWTYEKWHSGKAICWGTGTHTVNCTNSWGAAYAFYNSTTTEHDNFPSGLFIATPHLTYGLSSTTNAVFVLSGGGTSEDCTASRTMGLQFSRATSVSGIVVKIDWLAIGKWK